MTSYTGYQSEGASSSKLFFWCDIASSEYLIELCHPVSAAAGRQSLRSASRGDLIIPSFRLRTFGSRAFAISGPQLWNSLPLDVRQSRENLMQLKTKLKTFLFQQFWALLWIQSNEGPYKCSILLLLLLLLIIINAHIVDQRYCDFHVPLKMRVLCIRPIDVILYEQSPSWKWLRKIPGRGPSVGCLNCYYYYYSLLPCILHIRCIGCCNPLSAATKLRRPTLCAFIYMAQLWVSPQSVGEAYSIPFCPSAVPIAATHLSSPEVGNGLSWLIPRPSGFREVGSTDIIIQQDCYS